jgi:hypothetical protein
MWTVIGALASLAMLFAYLWVERASFATALEIATRAMVGSVLIATPAAALGFVGALFYHDNLRPVLSAAFAMFLLVAVPSGIGSMTAEGMMGAKIAGVICGAGALLALLVTGYLYNYPTTEGFILLWGPIFVGTLAAGLGYAGGVTIRAVERWRKGR